MSEKVIVFEFFYLSFYLVIEHVTFSYSNIELQSSRLKMLALRQNKAN